MSRILVVDDSLAVRRVVELALEDRQFTVLCASLGSEATERIERDSPDLVVCDVFLPDTDGFRICEFVRSHPRLARTPVILMSGAADDSVRERADRARADVLLSKPFSTNDLLRHIDDLLASERADGAGGAIPTRPVHPPVALTGAPWQGDGATPALPLEAALAQLRAAAGLDLALIVGRSGDLIGWTGEAGVRLEMAGALAACVLESAGILGRELGQEPVQGMTLEYARGTVLVEGLGPGTLLAVLVPDRAPLPTVRYHVRKAIPELARAL